MRGCLRIVICSNYNGSRLWAVVNGMGYITKHCDGSLRWCWVVYYSIIPKQKKKSGELFKLTDLQTKLMSSRGRVIWEEDDSISRISNGDYEALFPWRGITIMMEVGQL